MSSFSLAQACLTASAVAGFTGTARRRIRRLAAELGLRYSGDLVFGLSTHLVVASNTQPAGAKHAAAKQWGLPVVAEQWLWDSRKAGLLLPVDSYLCATQAGGECTEATGSTASQPRAVQDTQGQPLAASSIPCTDQSKLLRNLEKEGWCAERLGSGNRDPKHSTDLSAKKPCSHVACQQSLVSAPHSQRSQAPGGTHQQAVVATAASAVHSSSHLSTAAAADAAATKAQGPALLRTGQAQQGPACRARNRACTALQDPHALAAQTHLAADDLQNQPPNHANNAAAANSRQRKPLPACPHARLSTPRTLQLAQAPTSRAVNTTNSDPAGAVTKLVSDRQCHAAGNMGSQGQLQQGIVPTPSNKPQRHGACQEGHAANDQPRFADACIEEPEILRQAVPEEWCSPTALAISPSVKGSIPGVPAGCAFSGHDVSVTFMTAASRPQVDCKGHQKAASCSLRLPA